MRVRTFIIPAIFVVGAVAAVLLFEKATDSPIPFLDEPADARVAAAAAQRSADPRFDHVRAFLASIPDTKNLVTSAHGAPMPHAPQIQLRHFRGDRVVAGAIEVRRGEATVGLFQNWMELVPVDGSRFVLHRAWEGAEVLLVGVTVDRLSPLATPDLTERASAIGGGDELFVFEEAAWSEARIPRDLPPGEHPFSFSEGLAGIEEILLLYPSTRSDAPNQTHVMRIAPRQGRITIVAPARRSGFQAFDDIQAHCRLFRDPTSGRAVGDGLRLRAFVLTQDLTAVETWPD